MQVKMGRLPSRKSGRYAESTAGTCGTIASDLLPLIPADYRFMGLRQEAERERSVQSRVRPAQCSSGVLGIAGLILAGIT